MVKYKVYIDGRLAGCASADRFLDLDLTMFDDPKAAGFKIEEMCQKAEERGSILSNDEYLDKRVGLELFSVYKLKIELKRYEKTRMTVNFFEENGDLLCTSLLEINGGHIDVLLSVAPHLCSIDNVRHFAEMVSSARLITAFLVDVVETSGIMEFRLLDYDTMQREAIMHVWEERHRVLAT